MKDLIVVAYHCKLDILPLHYTTIFRRRQAANDSFFPGIDSLTAGRYNLTCMRVCKFG